MVRRAPGGARSHPSPAGLMSAAIAATLLGSGCADTVRPVLGGLKIGPATGETLTVPALLTETLPFEYPPDAWERGVGGETVLRLHITDAGVVDSVHVVQSSGDASLDSASVAGARRLRYRPARRGDETVAIWAYLPVRYPLPERAKAPGGAR